MATRTRTMKMGFHAGLLFLGTVFIPLTHSFQVGNGASLSLPPGGPQPPPAYMVDNTNNQFGVAPDKHVLDGPATEPFNLATWQRIHEHDADLISSIDIAKSEEHAQAILAGPTADDYWLSNIAHGIMPLAPSGYKFYRNVKDYGAKGDGSTDDTAAINKAVTDGNRCGANCGSTTVTGALVYFPPGTYKISTPIIQYYHTQFVGNPKNRPVIKGAANFSGIALVDSDYYIPNGNGSEWYINQSNFYRQIRNMVFDTIAMARTNVQGGQQYVPTGIHWQVGQATSITNCHFEMALSDAKGPATAVGIFMENGSGGFVSDLTFHGGNIGFRAGSQQFTARSLYFTNCLTAISHVWNWGFTWQNITCNSVYVAIDCTAHTGLTGQGTGSISVIDSQFTNVPYAIPISSEGIQPNIVIDNLRVENVPAVVLISGGRTLLSGSTNPSTITQWAMGLQYKSTNGGGSYIQDFVTPTPAKPANLLSQGKYFARSKPQYEGVAVGNVVVATANGVSNANTGDQTNAINVLLANHIGSVIFFPAGIYRVQGTIKVPVGSKIIGEGWPQIMATGPYFQDPSQPKVMVQVGQPGDSGIIEITDMLFTVQGATAGCILMEWNVHESSQGSAGMWDSHFRVGGAAGSNLQLADCPTGTAIPNPKCQAASLMLHVTNKASGYFENVWAWVADHDLDNPNNAKVGEGQDGVPVNVLTNVNVYCARGVLIESQGPSWFVGTASEHSQFYQYQLVRARNIYLGHMQTETPYYQPTPNATQPFAVNTQFIQDPVFLGCTEPYCAEAWALRILFSDNIFIYSAGFYSFFSGSSLGCVAKGNCQKRLIETTFTTGLWLYNIFTVGSTEIISPGDGIPPILASFWTQRGYSSEIAMWLVQSGATPPVTTTTSLPPATSTTSTAAPSPTETTCLLTGWTTGALGNCNPQGKCDGGSYTAGFSLSYLNGPLLGLSQQDKGGTKPASNTEVTIPKWELGNPTDLQWEANYIVSFSNCRVNEQYKGSPADGSYCKDNGLDGVGDICEECSVKFPCPSDLVPFDKHDCTVSAKYHDSWVESALARYRTVFRASNEDSAGTYCNFWYTCGFPFINPQCGFDSKVDGGVWRIDVSVAQGPVGQAQYNGCLASTLMEWSQYQNCRIVDF